MGGFTDLAPLDRGRRRSGALRLGLRMLVLRAPHVEQRRGVCTVPPGELSRLRRGRNRK